MSRILAVVAVVLALLSAACLTSTPVSAAVCGGAGYSLNSLTYADYIFNDTVSQFVYYFHPCGNVSNSLCQQLENSQAGGTMLCQLPYSGGTGYSLSTWTNTAQSSTVWTAFGQRFGGPGVSMQLADGELCGGLGSRVLKANFFCNRQGLPGQATILAVYAFPTCTYNINISTLAACPGSSVSTCGTTRNGVTLDLTSITTTDLVWQTPVATNLNYTYYFRPCGTVTSAQCANNPYGDVSGEAMVCQAAGQSGELSPYTYDIAWWNPLLANWRPIRGGAAWRMYIQDGTTCDANNGISRALTVDFFCVPAATTPIFNFLNETSTCRYYINISTSAACTSTQLGDTIDTNPECGGDEFDLEFASATDLVWTTPAGTAQYVFRPCGVVSNLVCQAAATTNNSMMCQSYPGSTTTYDVAQWLNGTGTTWTPTLNGIQMYTANGDYCAADGQVRTLTVNFICQQNPNPQYIVFLNFSEPSSCAYVAYVGTSAVCRSTGRGSQGYCGSGGYDFSLLPGSVYAYTDPAGDYTYYLQPCGVVQVAQCANQTSTAAAMMCQAAIGSGAAYNVAVYDYNSVNWLQVTNGWLLFVQDGTTCIIAAGTYQRALKVYFYCNTGTAFTVPTFYNVTEDPNQQCSYIATIYTPQACAPVARGASTGAYIPAGTNAGSTGTYAYEAASSCGGPYNLSPLSSSDLSITANGYQWFLRICGAVSNSNCTAAAYAAQTAGWMMCQNSLTGGDYEGAVYTPWAEVYQPVRNGMIMTVSDGAQCGTAGARVTRVWFQCNSSVPLAAITNVTEVPTCMYTFIVQTSLVCPVAATTCGGAGYSLNALTTRGDLQLTNSTSGYNYYFAPCSTVQNAQCQANQLTQSSMLCQASTSSNSTYDIAVYIPTSTTWTALASGGVTMTVQDGATCDGYDYLRKLTVNFQCSTSNGLYQFVSMIENPRCFYTATINTGVACNQLTGGGSSGLSGGAIAGIVIGVIVGVLILLGIVLAVCCGLCSGLRRSKKSSNTSYGSDGTDAAAASGTGQFSGLESSQVEMETRESAESAE